jgi:hypothetical protein
VTKECFFKKYTEERPARKWEGQSLGYLKETAQVKEIPSTEALSENT